MPFSTRTFDYFVDGSQLRENGNIYGWGDIHLSHITAPEIDGNHSVIFRLRVEAEPKEEFEIGHTEA
jgi:hypothetical protein